MVETAMNFALKSLKADTKDGELRKAGRPACRRAERVCDTAVAHFVERHVKEMEEHLRRGDQRGFFQTSPIHGGGGNEEDRVGLHSR